MNIGYPKGPKNQGLILLSYYSNCGESMPDFQTQP